MTFLIKFILVSNFSLFESDYSCNSKYLNKMISQYETVHLHMLSLPAWNNLSMQCVRNIFMQSNKTIYFHEQGICVRNFQNIETLLLVESTILLQVQQTESNTFLYIKQIKRIKIILSLEPKTLLHYSRPFPWQMRVLYTILR